MEIFGHRGFPTVAPENTMPSFEAALKAGVRALEFDVTLSRDGIPFLLHDRTLDRTTSAQGIATQKNWDQLKTLDAGAWFSAQFAGTRLPLLEEVLATYGKKALLNIEIKKEAVAHRWKNGVEDKVIQLVQKYGIEENVIISSFSARAVKRVSLARVGIKTAFLRAHALRILPDILTRRFHADGLHLPLRGLRVKEIISAREKGIPVRVYTVNQLDQAKRLAEWGVAGIFTDQAAMMVDYFKP